MQRTACQPRNGGSIPDNWGSTSHHLCQLNTIIMAVHPYLLGLAFLSPWKAGFGNILDNNVHIQPKWRWVMLTWPGIFITVEGCFGNSFGNNVYKRLIHRNTWTQVSLTSLSLWQSFPTAYLQTLRMPCVGRKWQTPGWYHPLPLHFGMTASYAKQGPQVCKTKTNFLFNSVKTIHKL